MQEPIITQEDILKAERKHWEDLYYQENSLVGVLRSRIQALEAKVNYLKSEIAYMRKYKENIDDSK